MRIAVIADIHANLPALMRVKQALDSDSPDLTVVLGDVASKGPYPSECAQEVLSMQATLVKGTAEDRVLKPVPTPDGSCKAFYDLCQMELWMKQRLSKEVQQKIAETPMMLTVDSPAGSIVMFHATPDDTTKVITPWSTPRFVDLLTRKKQAQKIVYAHTHHALVTAIEGHLIMNSGSVGSPFDGDPRASYLLIDAGTTSLAATVRRVEYDVERAVRAGYERGMPASDKYERMVRLGRYPW